MLESERFLLVADVDGTLTEVRSIWEYLLKSVNKWEDAGQKHLQAYLAGKIDYPRFAQLDARAFQGIPRAQLVEYVEKIPLRPGVEMMLKRVNRRGGRVVLLSSGLDLMLDLFPYVQQRFANHLNVVDGVCDGSATVRVPIDGKADILRGVLKSSRLSRDRLIVMGDSGGDISMMKQAGFSIAVDPVSDDVSREASATVDGRNMIQVVELIEDYLSGIEIRRPRRSRRNRGEDLQRAIS